MKIVIEMTPQMWALVREGHIPVRAYECIVKGTPLPKGHGRLIDKDHMIAISQLRAEIMKLQTYKMYEGENTVYVERDDVLQIFDKYAESEE